MKRFAPLVSRQIESAISKLTATPHYVCAGHSIPDLPPIDASVAEQRRIRDQIVFGKRIMPGDSVPMCRRIEYVVGSVYDAYDDVRADSNCYVITTDRHVYVCLDNNNGSPSIVMPTIVDPSGPFATSDGYVWRFMYTVPSDVALKFAVPGLMPVIQDNAVRAAATSGIVRMVVTAAGSGYSTYATSRVLGTTSNSTAVTLHLEPTLSPVANFFVGCALSVTSGGGNGLNTPIRSYVANTVGRFAVIDIGPAASAINLGSVVRIAPNVVVRGNGQGFAGLLEIDPTSNTAMGVLVTNPGSGYTQATATVENNPLFGSGAVVRPILAPAGGHGSSVVDELPTEGLCVSVTFANTQMNTIPTEATVRTVSILGEPNTLAGTPASALTFRAAAQVSLNTPGGVPFARYETVRTSDGNGSAVVAFANTTSAILTSMRGTMAAMQVLIGDQSQTVATIQALNTPTANAHSGHLLCAANVDPIDRSPTSSEIVRLTIRT